MDTKFPIVFSLAVICATASPVFSQQDPGSPAVPVDAPKTAPGRPGGDNRPDKKPGAAGHDRNWPEEFSKRLEKMAPKERERFMENLQRWKSMGEDERRKLKEAGRDDWSRMREEVNKTAKDLGLTLDRDQREMFELRFRQERRKVEQKVREQMDAIRQPLLKEMRDVLGQEFGGAALKPGFSPAPSASPAPVASPEAAAGN